jgi:hypothetical protein
VAVLPRCRHRPGRNGPRVISVAHVGAGGSGHGGPGAARSLSRPVRTGADLRTPIDGGGCVARHPSGRARPQQDRSAAEAPGRSTRQEAGRRRAAHTPHGADVLACGDRRSPLPTRSRVVVASGPRRPRASAAGPGRQPRGRAHGDRHGRSGPGRSSPLRSVAHRRLPRRYHPRAAPSFASERRVGRPRLDRASGHSSGVKRALARRSTGGYVAASSNESRSARSRVASSAMTGMYSRSSSSCVDGDAAGSPSRSRSS